MAIPQAYRNNFNTLLRAAGQGDLALVESADAATGEARYILCAIRPPIGDDPDFIITPFGHLCMGNPYEEYTDPITALNQSEASGHG